MKLELSEKFLVEDMVKKSVTEAKLSLGENFEIDRLTGDASTRRYYRVSDQKDSYVVCLGDPVLKGKVENSFVKVQSLMSASGVRVPKIYHKDLPRGYLLQEDLGDQTFLLELSNIQDKMEELDLYQNAVDTLIKIHSIDLSESKKEDYYKLEFDFNKFSEEVDFSIKFFVDSYLKIKLSDRDDKVLKKDLYKICEILSSEEKVFTHRDYHSRNIMIKDDELVVIDIQDARRGIPQYDLASLLDDCYYDVDEANKNKCLKIYFENFLKESKLQGDYNEYLYLYELMAVQRIFKAIGSFSYIYKIRKDQRYLKYIGFGFEKMRSYLLNHPEFSELRLLLSSIYYGN